jgi:DNA-binding SARP family transcriptional activator
MIEVVRIEAMFKFRVFLFGKFSIQRDNTSLEGLDAQKVRELFCYLLTYRNRPHARETLAGLLWGDSDLIHSRKQLRQALWLLQNALSAGDADGETPLLRVEDDWVQINPKASLWLDTDVFEQAYTQVKVIKARDLNLQQVQTLKEALALYHGDLLDGWYNDWCIFERERLQNMYLHILEKMLRYSLLHHAYEEGQAYGVEILHNDRASELAHTMLMRLYFLSGNRTEALRQFERCRTALKNDLGVKPSHRTMQLYHQICNDLPTNPPSQGCRPTEKTKSLDEVLTHLKQLNIFLTDVQALLQSEIRLIERRNGQE